MLDRLTVQQLKMIGKLFKIRGYKNKAQFCQKIYDSIDLKKVYLNIDLIPSVILKEFKESSWQHYSNRGWEPLYKLWILSQFGCDDVALSVLLLLLNSDNKIKKNLQIDPILLYLNGATIPEITSQLPISKILERVDSCLEVLEISAYNEKIEGENIALIQIKKILGLNIDSNDLIEMKLGVLFQANELSNVISALTLMESMFTVEETVEFFGLDSSVTFHENARLNIRLRYEELPPLFLHLSERYSNPEIAGYIGLWLMGLVATIGGALICKMADERVL